MTNCQLEIVGNESLNSIDRFDEFHVNLLFDRSIYRPMCTHMGNYVANFVTDVSFSTCQKLLTVTIKFGFHVVDNFVFANFCTEMITT